MKDAADYVDVDDFTRKHLIREAEFQQVADAESKVLRVSSRTIDGPYRRVAAITVYERVSR